MISAILRLINEMRYAHARAALDAMRMDLQGTAQITQLQQAALARAQVRALSILQRLNATRICR